MGSGSQQAGGQLREVATTFGLTRSAWHIFRRSAAVVTALSLVAFLLVAAQSPRPASAFTGWNQPHRGINVNAALDVTRIDHLVDITGANVIRLSFGDPAVWLMDKQPDASGDYNLVEPSFTKLFAVLGWAADEGVKVVIDPHTAPGFEENYTTGPSDPFWRNSEHNEWRVHLISLWVEIANRVDAWWDTEAYPGDPSEVIAGYDLLNEPAVPAPSLCGGDKWNALADDLVSAIRATGDQNTLIVEAAGYSTVSDCAAENSGWIPRTEGIANLDLPDDDNLVASAHFYVPYDFTHQGLGGRPVGQPYPGTVDGEYVDKATLSDALQPLRDFQASNDVPIFVGEFSASRAAGPDGEAWLTDLVDLMEDQRWSWTYHDYGAVNTGSCEWNPLKVYGAPSDPCGADVTTPKHQLLQQRFSENENPSDTNRSPTAKISSVHCAQLTCSLDGTQSSDTDGSVVSYLWNFGDGQTASGQVASHRFAGPGEHIVYLEVTDDDGATSTPIPQKVTVELSAWTATVAADTFGRSATDGWGSADVGGAWTLEESDSWYVDDFSVDGTGGTITAPPGHSRTVGLNEVLVSDFDLATNFSANTTTIDGTTLYLRGRQEGNVEDETGTHLEGRVKLQADGSVTTWLLRFVNGIQTDLTSTTVPNLTHTPGTPLRVRFQATGNHIGLNVWDPTQPEPAAWTLETTDAHPALTGPGTVAIHQYNDSDNTTPVSLTIDNLTINPR